MYRRDFIPALALMVSPARARADDDDLDPPELTPQVAGSYAVHAMLASNAYHRTDRLRFAVEQLGWVQVDLQGRPTREPTVQLQRTGLAYDIHEQQDSGEVVLAFRGTDSTRDFFHANLAVWPFSGQYKQARQHVEAYTAQHPGRKITLTGHSLGGGLALGVSVRQGCDAVVFNSSPRVFDGIGDRYASAQRVMVYEGGEILTAARKLWQRKFLHIVPRDNIYRASFDYGGANKHRSDQLALGLLRLGATVDEDLARVLAALDEAVPRPRPTGPGA